MIKKNLANFITGSRIVCAVALLFCPLFSVWFYVLYFTAGATDIADGAVARATKTESRFGSYFDSAADLALVAVCLVKLLPKLRAPVWLYVCVGVIAIIKICSVVSGLAMRKKVVVLHTAMNRITGALLFIFPLTLQVIDFRYSAALICAVAAFAAVQEGHFIRTGRETG